MKLKKNVAVAQWLGHATPKQARSAARRAGTSVAHLRHIAAGRRQVSAALALRLVRATKTPSGLNPPLTQDQLCHACKICPYLRAVKKA